MHILTTRVLNSKHEQEALDVGLVMVSHTTNKYYNKYYKKDCNHFVFLRPDHVRHNNFLCGICLEGKIEKDAESLGLRVLPKDGSEKNRNYRWYIVAKCNHKIQITIQHVRKNSFVCYECIQEKHQKEASSIGFELLEIQASRPRYKVYRKDCGCVQELEPSKVRAHKKTYCLTCLDSLYRKSASENDAKYLGASLTDRNQQLIQFNKCGHIVGVHADSLKRSRVYCDQCGTNHYHKQSTIYLLKLTNSEGYSWLKLGISSMLDLRISQYGLCPSVKIVKMCLVDVDKAITALRIEKKLHKKFKSFNLNKNLMKKYHTESGFTECYSLEAESLMLLDLDKLNKEHNAE